MDRFAELLDRLVLTPSRNGKLTLLKDYFREVPDPDRGLALAAITGDLAIAAIKPAMLRMLVTERIDPVLFGYSYDYVGDLAETVSLVWPEPEPHRRRNSTLSLADVVERLQAASRSDGPSVLAALLDQASIPARFAIIKLVTGGLRIGVSARLAKQALADFGSVDVAEVEELWHGLAPPYEGLFAWLEGRAPKPEQSARALFRPVMLSHPVEDNDLAKLDPADYVAEWKWDGIRVQAVSLGGTRRLYSRTGDDVSGAFPDLVDAMDFDAALDGELLVGRPPDWTGSFSDLQQRLNRKSVSPKMRERYPAFVRCYDLLQQGAEDLRPLPFTERRQRLEDFIAPARPGPLRPVADHRLRELGRAGGAADLATASDHRRGDDQAPRLGLRGGAAQGPLVQMEARPLHRRRGADVRAARPREALELLFRLHVRGVDRTGRGRRAGAGRQGLFRLHRRGAQADRQICAGQHGGALWPGAVGPRRSGPRPGPGGRLRRAQPLAAPPLRGGDALSPDLAPAVGQAALRGRPAGDADGHARRIVSSRFNLSPSLRAKNGGMKGNSTSLAGADLRPVAWGIVGTGRIAGQFAADLAHAPGARLAAVLSRDPAKAGAFAARHAGAPRAYGELSGFMADPTVEIVYLATPNYTHVWLARAALFAGKAVLVEKPLATSVADAEAIARAAATSGCFAMEAMWSRFLPAVEAARSMIACGAIGSIRRVTADLSYRRDERADPRLFDPVQGGGAALDLGVYPVSLAIRLLGKPAAVTGRWWAAASGVDLRSEFTLHYDGAEAQLSVGFDRDGDNRFLVEGSEGALRLDAPFLKARHLTLYHGRAARSAVFGPRRRADRLGKALDRLPFPGRRRLAFPFPGSGLQFEAIAAMEALRRGESGSPVMPLAESREVLAAIETVLGAPPQRR